MSSQSNFVLTTIETVLNVMPAYASKEQSHKVLIDIYPINDWITEIDKIFGLHLSAKMVVNNFQDFESNFVISRNVFDQVIMACPCPPQFTLDSDLSSLLLCIAPFIKESMENASSDRFKLSVIDISFDKVGNENLTIKYSIKNNI